MQQSAPISPTDLFLPAAAELQATAQPPGRGAAMASTLRAFAEQAKPDVRYSASVMRLAYLLLGQHRGDDTPPVTARRSTCLEIADAIGAAHILGPRPAPGSINGAEMSGVLSWWAFATLTPGDDARSAAIRDTARRESAELDDVIRGLGKSAPLAGQRLIDVARTEVLVARGAKRTHAYIDLGGDPMAGGRDGGPAVRAALETLREAGYTVDLDGRSGQIEIEVDTSLRPVKSRREGTVNMPGTEDPVVRGVLALEALDNIVRRLRNPSGDARRDGATLRVLEAALINALEQFPEGPTQAPINVITAAFELDASQGAVLADILIATRRALAHAAGVDAF